MTYSKARPSALCDQARTCTLLLGVAKGFVSAAGHHWKIRLPEMHAVGSAPLTPALHTAKQGALLKHPTLGHLVEQIHRPTFPLAQGR